MSEPLDVTELVQRAQRGDKEALDRLAEFSVKLLRVYVYRLTLQEDLTQEIVQETLLEMVKILGKLKNTDRFLPWLYGIATNKLRHFYRSEATLRRASTSHSKQHASDESPEQGLENLLSQELKEIVTGAIQGLKTRHRAVLVMRCYDGMSYAEIAESMGTTEFGTRMLFIRAKKALQRQLAKSGLGRGSLLAILILFGKMTAPSKAAAAQISVTAGTIHAGMLAGAVGLATSKAALVALTAGAVAVGTAVGPMDLLGRKTASPSGPALTSFAGSTVKTRDSLEKNWYFLPEGEDGPLMRRAQLDTRDNRSKWIVLQDDQANYAYDGQTVSINNYRAWSENVLRLPTDNPAITAFLTRMEGIRSKTPYVPVSGSQILISAVENEDGQEIHPTVVHRQTVLNEDFFLDWPQEVDQVDNRDLMHKRGWTYFQVDGHLRGTSISGQGRIPFVYVSSRRVSPWIALRVGDLTLTDTPSNATVYGRPDQKAIRLEQGTFFRGLSRPWMGLHTLDSIRRDAAELQVPFDTKLSQDKTTAQVTLDMGDLKACYTVDLYADVLQRIDLYEGDQNIGKLIFSYAQDLGQIQAPRLPSVQAAGYERGNDRMGILWLHQLAQGRLLD